MSKIIRLKYGTLRGPRHAFSAGSPYELLLVTTSYLKYDGDISALMQTNSILYHALNPSLYQHNIRYFGRSAFEWAIFNGVTPVVRRMLEGVHPDNKLLELAIRHGHADVVRVLLDYGLHPDPAGWVYSVLGNKNKQKKFRKNPNRDEIEMEFLPLYLASQYNRQSVLRVLISYARRSANYATATQQGTSLPNQSREGMDALHMPLTTFPGAWLMKTAPYCGCIAVVKFLAGRLQFTVKT